MRTISKENVIYAFGPENRPSDTVALDETFWIETDDCYSGQMQTEKDVRPNINTDIMDASTGPLQVREVNRGDVIRVTIEEIQLASHGVMPTSPGLGTLGDLISSANTKIIPIRDGFAHFSDTIKLPLTPMVGVLGVSPALGSIHCATPGDHGANMDTKDLRPGSKVYFPVFVDGANLALGDLHACMGDGELSGTGIETAGRVKLTISKIPDLSLKMPVVETEDAFMVIASEGTFEQSTRKALLYATELLAAAQDLDFPDAYRLLSAACDLKISQIVNPMITVRVAIPRNLISDLFTQAQ